MIHSTRMSSTKASLRKLMRECVKNLNYQDKRRQSDLVACRLWEHPRYKMASRISLYLSTRDEIDTVPILRRALEEDKKQCFIPCIKKKTTVLSSGDKEPRMSMLEIKSMSEFDSLPLNKYGIKEPNQIVLDQMERSHAKPGDLDLILVPGVAFSIDGRRLGHGKGYYDEFLTHWSSNSSLTVYCIGLAFREQIVASTLAQDEHDYVLDEVLVS